MTQGVGGLSSVMENKSDFRYLSPEADVIEIEMEGILCGSNEGVGENDGNW